MRKATSRLIVVIKTVETITREYSLEVPDQTTSENAYLIVDKADERRFGWVEQDFTAIETLSEITTPEGSLLWKPQN